MTSPCGVDETNSGEGKGGGIIGEATAWASDGIQGMSGTQSMPLYIFILGRP